VCTLQSRRSVVPQLDRPGDVAARPGDFRLSLVQQEFQPVVLRTRSVETRPCSKSLANAFGRDIGRRPIRPSPRAFPNVVAGCLCSMLRVARKAVANALSRARPTPWLWNRITTNQRD